MTILPLDASQPNIAYSIWEEPVPGQYYALGVDPAGPGDSGANTAARMWCDRPRRLVAEAVGNASEEVWATELEKFGCYYTPEYPAWIAIEVFSYGRVMLSLLQTGNKLYGVNQYPHIYHEPALTDLRDGIHRPGPAAGWGAGGGQARLKRSGYLFPAAKEALQYARDNPHAMPDATGVLEYRNTKYIDGRPDPAPGEKIDRVVADGLAWLVFKQDIFAGMYPGEQQPVKNENMWYVDKDKIMFNPLGKGQRDEKESYWFK